MCAGQLGSVHNLGAIFEGFAKGFWVASVDFVTLPKECGRTGENQLYQDSLPLSCSCVSGTILP
jgi:hypothetical protein